jgi:hypothetical protein
MRILRNVDLVILGLALPVFIAAGLPLLGWGATTAAWLAARGVQSFAQSKARAKGTRQSALGARAASLLGRLYLVTAAVFVAGLIERKAGLSGAGLALVVFTVWFMSGLILSTFDEESGK